MDGVIYFLIIKRKNYKLYVVFTFTVSYHKFHSVVDFYCNLLSGGHLVLVPFARSLASNSALSRKSFIAAISDRLIHYSFLPGIAIIIDNF